VHNCENHSIDVSTHDLNLVKVQLRQTDHIYTIRSIIFREGDNDRLPFGLTSFIDDKAYIIDGIEGNRFNRENVSRAETIFPLRQSVQRHTPSHMDELTTVSIDIIMEIKAEYWMNAVNNDGFLERQPKGICAKYDCDTVVVITVRRGNGSNDSDRCRYELIQWKRNEFAEKWRH
jgi:hypothetical protein